MPLSKKRDQERKRLSRLENASVQPQQAKIRELRDMIKGIKVGLIQPEPSMTLHGDYLADDECEDWPDIDADGNMIPDF